MKRMLLILASFALNLGIIANYVHKCCRLLASTCRNGYGTYRTAGYAASGAYNSSWGPLYTIYG